MIRLASVDESVAIGDGKRLKKWVREISNDLPPEFKVRITQQLQLE